MHQYYIARSLVQVQPDESKSPRHDSVTTSPSNSSWATQAWFWHHPLVPQLGHPGMILWPHHPLVPQLVKENIWTNTTFPQVSLWHCSVTFCLPLQIWTQGRQRCPNKHQLSTLQLHQETYRNVWRLEDASRWTSTFNFLPVAWQILRSPPRNTDYLHTSTSENQSLTRSQPNWMKCYKQHADVITWTHQ